MSDYEKPIFRQTPNLPGVPTARSAELTKEAYVQFHKDFCARMHEVTKRKSADYTGHSSDPFANFKMVEHFNVASLETGIFIRLLDKMSRLSSFLKKGVLEVKDESIEDTILDACNYLIILASAIQDKKEREKK